MDTPTSISACYCGCPVML
ncbi:hypothetical protein Golob_005287, partial [Gossypium lobatum]|nr:hypothetical protein [Gossypium lobatum]